jgi:sporulation protein YlmC with PRC-barrel domain
MRLELGSPVRCSDAPFGELADVVVDPRAWRVTHVVVQPHHHPGGARLVPAERASEHRREILLDCTTAELEALPHVNEIRGSRTVTSSDGEHLGHVDGLLVSHDGTADIVLERGHLWHSREIVIPAAAIAGVEDDAVTLTLTKEQVGALAVPGAQRWF